MKTLAQGKNSNAIIKLLRVLLNTAQGNIGDASHLEDSALKEIADVIEFEGTGQGQTTADQGYAGAHPDDIEFKNLPKGSDQFDYLLSATKDNIIMKRGDEDEA
jgi:hypothetical protein